MIEIKSMQQLNNYEPKDHIDYNVTMSSLNTKRVVSNAVANVLLMTLHETENVYGGKLKLFETQKFNVFEKFNAQ